MCKEEKKEQEKELILDIKGWDPKVGVKEAEKERKEL